MRIIIAPAKKMRSDPDSLAPAGLPDFLPETEVLCAALRSMDPAALQRLWRCNDRIAALNVRRLEEMDLRRNLTPAILAYEGIQYQYMAPGVFSQGEYDYVQTYLRILSGFYGLLRPFDGVTPYRLEMQAKLAVGGARDLYGFWGDRLARRLFAETDCILNLASKEYSLCVSRFLEPSVRFVTCVFGQEKDGKVLEQGTQCKMARGEMVRYLAETGAETLEAVRGFDRLDYRFSPAHSDEETLVFLRP
ncbi:MAG TPA: peroxide stress protein YaaA [Candidatus Avoscillospira stercorigallinarum]|uniref:UPF0246 protein IAA67_02755 n=1 Tax=Candidatus Avoscillospira stercorigallinarum TaxID=2840708 RepID=A0A9D0Z4Z6_9FIRM|nr:peroxide stress protein YaaA [Candidatus Avoscillospira stercorigallinarum]